MIFKKFQENFPDHHSCDNSERKCYHEAIRSSQSSRFFTGVDFDKDGSVRYLEFIDILAELKRSAVEIYITDHQSAIRLGCFLGLFFILALGELLKPRLVPTVSKASRWRSNLGLTLLNALLVWFLGWFTPVVVAHLAEQRQWGLLQQVEAAEPIKIVVAVLFLDFLIYGQHVLFHKIPLCWRLHRVHHTDLNFDLTTGVRFHPFEILLSLLIKIVAIILIGAPVLAVLIFEILLNGSSMFNHSNFFLPLNVDRIARKFIVTPDMHRVHHSVVPYETDSNYGFNFSWWDRLFGTYRDQPEAGHEGMSIGLKEFREPGSLKLPGLLVQPFIRVTRKKS